MHAVPVLILSFAVHTQLCTSNPYYGNVKRNVVSAFRHDHMKSGLLSWPRPNNCTPHVEKNIQVDRYAIYRTGQEYVRPRRTAIRYPERPRIIGKMVGKCMSYLAQLINKGNVQGTVIENHGIDARSTRQRLQTDMEIYLLFFLPRSSTN